MSKVKEKSPAFYVHTTDNHVRVSFWPDATGMHVALTLDPAEGLRLARDLTKAVDALPRVASAADLKLVA